MDGEIETPIKNIIEESRYTNCRIKDSTVNIPSSNDKNTFTNDQEDAVKACMETGSGKVQKRQITSYSLHMFVSEDEFNSILNVSDLFFIFYLGTEKFNKLFISEKKVDSKVFIIVNIILLSNNDTLYKRFRSNLQLDRMYIHLLQYKYKILLDSICLHFSLINYTINIFILNA